MSAYKHAFAISSDSTPERLDLARSVLEQGTAVVLLDGQVAIRPSGECLLCEVIDPFTEGPRIGTRLEALLASGKELVKESLLYDFLRTKELHWIVVADHGMGTEQLWPSA